MRGLRRYSLVFLGVLLFLLWRLSWHNFSVVGGAQQEKGCDHTTTGTSTIAPGNVSMHYVDLSKRPLLVRFNWYTKKKTPIHLG